MDTKWKNRKNVISFIIFFLGVSLTLGGMTGLLKNKPGRTHLWQIGKLLESDYQESRNFREYIADRLENFLIMAAGGVPVNTWEYDYSVAYDSGFAYGEGLVYNYDNGEYYSYDDSEYEDYLNSMEERESQIRELEDSMEELEEMWDEYADMVESAGENSDEHADELEMYRQEIEAYQKELDDYRRSLDDGTDSMEDYLSRSGKPLSDEDKKKAAESYHDRIKGDKNLLYTISYDGKVLYSNSDALTAKGGLAAVEGKSSDGTALEDYNFFLYFDGEKVRIVKDGKELNVYGDGYYRDVTDWREGSSWYVPGYLNFPVDEKIKKAAVCIAAAKEPVFYTEGSYGNIGSRQLGNALYWMNYNCQGNRQILLQDAVCLAVGAALLLLSFLSRKSRREAVRGIAYFQSKIWVEWKVLLTAGVLYPAIRFAARGSYDYGLWQELREGYLYEYGADTLFQLGTEALRDIYPLFWVIVFWVVYFICIDLRHNKKVWKHGLIEKLCRTFSARALEQPISRKAAFRNRIVIVMAVFYGLLTVAAVIFGTAGYGNGWGACLLVILAAVGFLAAAYLTGKKNMETAKDMEALADCVGEIRSGNYTDIGGQFSGHDLEDIMTQLEDIRQGMAKAVDEQMKSERVKVELIANVSHDIKTPLTSIISYVQFLKQEEGLPDHVKDYITILDEKSQRLKNMVQDVFAVSKAASGELPVHREELDFGKLLRQTMADMEEQIDGSAVAFRTEIPESPVMIMADGQRLYRVFQNLFQNAIKYSLDGSRVYVTLKTDGGLAAASVKNTSHAELDKGMDFAERFTRGDQSRTDGGSGLGLSIAQSFTEACGGTFTWETDADLFVVKVTFKTV